MNSLPKGNSALLMTEEEFEETLQRGKRTKENGPKREIPKKIRKSASQNATKASSEYTKLAKQEEEQLDTATEAHTYTTLYHDLLYIGLIHVVMLTSPMGPLNRLPG